MKWIYGKQDWRTYERGQENCFLMTNGLGGFSSLTMTGSVARNDHALFMACLKAPNHRYNMVHRLREELTLGQERYTISSQEFADKSREKGYRYLSEFSYEDTPVWRFDVSGIEIQKEAAMRQGENMAVLSYRIKNRTGRDAVLSVTPFYQFTAKGNQPEEDQRFTFREGDIESRGLTMGLETDGTVCGIPEETETYFYSYDACDGRRKTGRAKAIHRIDLKVEAGKEREFGILFKMAVGEAPAKERENTQERTGTVAETAAAVAEEMKNRRRRLEKEAGFTSPLAGFLSRSADQFVSKRASTDGKTILAGFPFFEDWGSPFREYVSPPAALTRQGPSCVHLHSMSRGGSCRTCFRKERTTLCTIQWMRRSFLSTVSGCIWKRPEIWSSSGRCTRSWSGSWKGTAEEQNIPSAWARTV